MKPPRMLAFGGAAAITLGLIAVGLSPAAQAATEGAASTSTGHLEVSANGRYILRLAEGASHAAVQEAAGRLGASVVTFQNELSMVVVEAPADARGSLANLPGVVAAAPDGEVEAQSLGFDPTSASYPGSMTNVTRLTGATEYWKKGYTGKGVDVAIIDTGIAPVSGLLDPAKVIVGADLSFESQSSDTRFLDTYGHGTNMAGIIAGREVAAGSGTAYAADTSNFYGMAPDARLLSVKLADHGGAVDVSQMIAAVDWVVRNRWSEGMNIKVLNLSYGTISQQDAQADPLSWAAEAAWKAGIAVVASAGNDGDSTIGLASPAYNPWVIAVGAQDTKGTAVYTDDSVPSFSERGVSGGRAPDLIAPGVGIVSLGVPGGKLSESYSSAKVGNEFLRGSGTSQSAAVVSGAAALLYSRHGWMGPDTVKKLLQTTATPLAGVSTAAQGSGALNLRTALTVVNPAIGSQSLPNGNGNGPLDKARGGQYVTLGGVQLRGEKDIMGNAWSSPDMAAKAKDGNAWNWMGSFNGADWTGGYLSPDTTSWAGKTWRGKTWQATTWQGKIWGGKTAGAWSGRRWTSAAWSGRRWTSAAWGSAVPTPSWTGRVWSSAGWK